MSRKIKVCKKQQDNYNKLRKILYLIEHPQNTDNKYEVFYNILNLCLIGISTYEKYHFDGEMHFY